MLMSLAENLARRLHTTSELMQEIAALKRRGHTYAAIAKKTDLNVHYIRGIVRLMNKGCINGQVQNLICLTTELYSKFSLWFGEVRAAIESLVNF